MAAGLGFKTFTTGEVLTAADVNGYLMQGILVFADAAARDAAITAPQEGQFAFLKDTNVTTYYTGSTWANVDTTGMTNPMTTTGDVIYSSSGSTPARLGIGTAGQVLKVNSGATAPEWAVDPTTDVVTTAGDLIYGTAADTVTRLGIGTAGQVLQVNSGATAPEWATPAAPTATFAGARVKKTGSQSIANNTVTTITWNDEDFDTDTYHDNSVDNSRFTIPAGKGGYYNIIANISMDGSNSGARVIEIFKNATRIDRVDRQPVTNQNNVLTSTIFDFAVGDYIEAKIYQDSGVSININTDSRFSLAYLGA